MKKNVIENVARGVRLLDDNRPGWETEINLSTLDLLHPNRCILGQLYGYFNDGCIALGIDIMEPYGMCPYSHEEGDTMQEWRRIITTRLNNRAAPAEV